MTSAFTCHASDETTEVPHPPAAGRHDGEDTASTAVSAAQRGGQGGYSEADPAGRAVRPAARANTTVSLISVALCARRRDMAGRALTLRRGADTWSRWIQARDVPDARGAPRGMKPVGRRAGRRKARGSG